MVRKLFVTLILASSLLTVPNWAKAQSKNIKSVEDVLKDIKPAGGMCPREEGLPLVGELPSQNDGLPDILCALSPAEAAALLTQPGAVAVDIRPPQEFFRFHIDGALNMGASELRMKSFLSNRPVILVGNGKGEREQYIACGQLKRAGFKHVKVLRGGMPAWLAQQFPIIGPRESTVSLVGLNAAQFWAETRFDANLILLPPGMASFRKDFPKAQPIPEESPEAVKAALEKRQQGRKNMPLASVVLLASSDFRQERVDALVQSLKPVPLLVHVDAAESFRQFMHTQEAVWKAQARGPKQPKCGP